MIRVEEDGTAYVGTAAEAIEVCDKSGVTNIVVEDPAEDRKLTALVKSLRGLL